MYLMFSRCICLGDPNKPYARTMYPRAQLSGQGACCLDTGFRHMSSAPDYASFRAMHVRCVRRGGGIFNNVYLFCKGGV